MKQILIVEDVTETLEWLCDVARQAFADCEIRTARGVREAIYALEGQTFDLALVDLGLPDGSGAEVVARLSERQPDAVIVVATIMGDDASVISALSRGAHGYLLKDLPEETFVWQLKQIEHGAPVLSPSIARRIVDHFRTTATPVDGGAELTRRERDVLALIGRGLRNSEAAEALGLTESTVASYIKSIYSKLGISTRAEAALRATSLGLARP